ncbi:CRISPR-associated endoribonuclease Cas6 [Sedimentibacter saalensis]|uniref:CRISPR-associated endoribonuclease Cas6 n=1 Tax=Sedimentibacter saalensis TaxID=130788 RepID=A0A562JEX5_9FIRM|nr:CRISPR-associated endoribonuclease Cas6 [Sedimentibacter saalensis]TWH81355.1 CRISPR-associated endoribonuclease Cas6 [Sedimentibacter saalensis]
MKILVQFELSKNELPLDYRRACVSFIKGSLFENSQELYENLYGNNGTKQKNFTFNLKLTGPKFMENEIYLEGKDVLLSISTNDIGLGIDLYNSILGRKGKTHPLSNDNFMKIKHVRLENHKNITTNEVMVKFYSPLVVRNHIKGEKDIYYFYDDNDFNDGLKKCVENQMKNCSLNEISNFDVELIPINPKKVIVKTFGINIPASIGVFKMKANTDVINALYQFGIGSRRSEGFGLFEIIS